MRVMLAPWEAEFQRLPTSILFGDLKICFAVFRLKAFHRKRICCKRIEFLIMTLSLHILMWSSFRDSILCTLHLLPCMCSVC